MTPENSVEGRFGSENLSSVDAKKLTDFLKSSGYADVSAGENENKTWVSFAKRTQIESVVNELVPRIEEAGVDAWNEMELVEFDAGTGKVTSRYKEGTIVRDRES